MCTIQAEISSGCFKELLIRKKPKLNLSVGGIDIVGLWMQPGGGAVGVAGIGFFVAVRKEPRPWDGFAFGFVLSRMERLIGIFHNASDSGMVSYPKSGAKVEVIIL